ncbi:uncharacterized protein LOC119984835 [Tripterygium wilfordii]|uniref:uncharacterized protein LOC119984835 n=1 Tax=Tripterygium wilfordii TaxID=458696 RepID=UPI0018F7EFA7|nr:uncharacterized protein LOC119984835 [Tripterygium wilfordii]
MSGVGGSTVHQTTTPVLAILHTKSFVNSKMAARTLSTRSLKLRSWQRCSKQIREQRARLYIIWRCTVLLVCWHD